VKLHISHRTTYHYSEPVTNSHHEARLAPRDTENQRALAHELTILPLPGSRRRRFDYFNNRAVHFSLSEPHRSLEVVASSTVEVSPVRMPVLENTPPWETVRDRLQGDRRRDVLDAYAMTFASTHVGLTPGLAEYAAPSFAQGQPALVAVRDLVSRIYKDFRYDPRATEVSTPLAEVLQRRRGVCQDFAHLAIGCLRAQGLAARYVSGYLLTRPPPGRPKLVGADASHAWFSTFIPDLGWVDFDPTNDLIPSDEHVTIAYGRDFADVTPMRGVILGGGQHQLVVAVDVNQAE
jgi:transglutaminase-like putative cysteine protease